MDGVIYGILSALSSDLVFVSSEVSGTNLSITDRINQAGGGVDTLSNDLPLCEELRLLTRWQR